MIKLKDILLEIAEEEHDNVITKREEHQALNFMRKEIIPAALDSYNTYHDTHNFKPVTVEELRKNLKKVDVDFPKITALQRGDESFSVYDPRIFYDAIIKGPTTLSDQRWKFTTLKSRKDGQFYVTWKHPYNFLGKWIPVKFS